MVRHFLTLRDFSRQELVEMLSLAMEIKRDFKASKIRRDLQGKILGMIFEKNSTRTRVSFEAGIYQLGGTGIFLSSRDIQLSRGESIPDSARVISSMLDMIMIRTFAHQRLEEFANFSSVPVINGLSDSFHPVQVMADYLTMIENGIFCPSDFPDLPHQAIPKMSYIGDGNNMAHSLLMLAAKFGFELNIATPEGYEPNSEILSHSLKIAEQSGAKIQIGHSPFDAIKDANVVVTDTWVSMGQDEEKQLRQKAFETFCIDTNLMKHAHQKAIFLHCLPAYRGQEVSEEVLEGSQSRVFQEAENRLHVQKGIMLWLYKNSKN